MNKNNNQLINLLTPWIAAFVIIFGVMTLFKYADVNFQKNSCPCEMLNDMDEE